MTAPAIRVQNLSKKFVLHNQGGAELPVLENIDLEVAPGECVVLDGPSGSGKSTLLKCLYANYRANTGTVHIREGDTETELGSYVSQFLRAIPRVPALDIVAEPLVDDAGDDPEKVREAQRLAKNLLLRLRIPQRLWFVPPATFSGGEQQRINIARSFIKPRPILLLDEPTASLDADNRVTVVSLINEARERGAAIVGIFHDARVRDSVATHVVNMTRPL